MEPPVQFNADHFRNEVVKVYQSFRPMTDEDIKNNVIRGQNIQRANGRVSIT